MRIHWVLAFAIACAACTDPVQHSYENAQQREIEAFTFRRPLALVWPEVVSVLAENGFRLHEKLPVEDRTLTSELNPDFEGATNGYRALVRVIRIDGWRYKLRIELQYQHGEHRSIESPNTMGRRAQRMSWAVIERSEPAKAAQILERLRDRS
jgi:hypothetical protein